MCNNNLLPTKAFCRDSRQMWTASAETETSENGLYIVKHFNIQQKLFDYLYLSLHTITQETSREAHKGITHFKPVIAFSITCKSQCLICEIKSSNCSIQLKVQKRFIAVQGSLQRFSSNVDSLG